MSKIKNLFFIIIIYFSPQTVSSYENSIVYKVNNEIITKYDIKKEIGYLTSLNPSLKNLKEEKVLSLAVQSIVNEKIKKVELEKNYSLGENPEDPVLKKILSNLYKNLGINNEEMFKEYLKKFGIDVDFVKQKLEIESLWNSLIYSKYKNQISVDENQIKKDLDDEFKLKKPKKEIFLSEILIRMTQADQQTILVKEVKESIKKIGFNNTANVYSISKSANKGGKIGWINESSLSPIILKEIKNLKKDEITKPIKLASGFLIIKVEDVRMIKNKIDKNTDLKNRIINEKNKQLDLLSTAYFNRIKKNIKIDEL